MDMLVGIVIGIVIGWVLFKRPEWATRFLNWLKQTLGIG